MHHGVLDEVSPERLYLSFVRRGGHNSRPRVSGLTLRDICSPAARPLPQATASSPLRSQPPLPKRRRTKCEATESRSGPLPPERSARRTGDVACPVASSSKPEGIRRFGGKSEATLYSLQSLLRPPAHGALCRKPKARTQGGRLRRR